MTNFLKRLIVACLVAHHHHEVVESSLYTISDERIRDMDMTPVLGRGYSIMTNQFHSTCLVVEKTTTPSYNYDYFFTDFTQSTDVEKTLSGKIAGSYSRVFVGHSARSASGSTSSASKVNTQTRTISATMRIERYYSSVRDEVTKLSEDAKQLLTGEDYVGFFNACGPNYVRGIRRAQELTAIFQFSSSSRESSRQFSTYLKTKKWRPGIANKKSRYEGRTSGNSKFKSQSQSLTIKIFGFGLGLSQEGSETLVASSMEEFEAVMKFGFRSMTQTEESYTVGKVHGIEVVPWAHNVEFQSAARLDSQDILRPLPRNLIPKAQLIDATDTTTKFASDNDDSRKKFRCRGPEYVIDKFGHCCELEQLYNAAQNKYRTLSDADVKKDVCRPIQSLDIAIVKDNVSNNAEFVSRLSSAIRYRLVAMATLERCISASNTIPDKYLDNFLQKNEAIKYDSGIDTPISVRHLKLAVDPSGDYSLLQHMGKELDEWIDMYYSPCLAAIYGLNVGSTPDVDPMYFMAEAWYSHKECMYLTCLTNNMRWDRESGGCEPALVTLDSAGSYTKDKDSNCAKDAEDLGTGATEKCKHTTENLNKFQTGAKACWTELPFRNVAYFVEHYCMPQVTKEEMADGAVKDNLKTRYAACRPVNTASAGRRLALETNYLNVYPLSDVQFLDEFEDHEEDYDYMHDELKNIKAPPEEEENDFFEDLRAKISKMRMDNEEQQKLEEEVQASKMQFAADLKKMIETARNATLD